MILKKFLDFQLRYTWAGILLSLLTIVGGFWFAKDIRLDTDLKSLLPSDSPSVLAMEEISPKAGGSNDLLLILQGGSLEEKVRAAQDFSKRLETMPDFVRSVQYTTPKNFFEEHKYMFMPARSLQSLLDRLAEERKKHAAVTDPLGLEAIIEEERNEAEPETRPASEDEESQMEFAKELLSRLDEMRPYYQTEEGDFLAIRVIPQLDSLDMEANRKVLRDFKKIVHEFPFKDYSDEIETEVMGSISRHIHRYDSIVADVSFGGWGILLILIIVSIYFKSLWASLILVPPLLVGMASGLGIVSLTEGRLNTIAVFLVLVVFGVGIEFGIHLWARMRQERRTKDLKESLWETWSGTGRATVTSAVSLLAGFALLTLSSFQGFAQFGRVAVILLACTAGATLIFLPTWIILVEKLRGQKAWSPSLADQILELARQPGRMMAAVYNRILRVSSLVLLAISAVFCVLYLRFDYQFDEGVKVTKRSEASKASGRIFNERLKPSAIAVFPNLEEAASFLEDYQFRQDEYPNIGFMSGLTTFFPVDQEERIRLLQHISDDLEISWLKNWKDEEIKEALIEIKNTAYDYEAYELEDVPEELRQPFVAADGSGDFMVYIFDIGGETDGLKSIRFVEELKRYFNDIGMSPLFSGQEVIFADIVSRVTKEGPWLVIGMLLLVFLICWFDFRKWTYAAVTILPVLFGFLLTGFLLVILEIQINFYNMVALSSLGSMVVDNSIHFFHRYLQLKQEGDPLAHRTASYAVSPTIITCTATSICGYGGMVFATHTGVASLGNVAVLGLFCCLIAAVVFFPAWLEKFSRSQKT